MRGSDPTSSGRPPGAAGARFWLALSWLALTWERLWRAFWPLATGGGLALALAISGLVSTWLAGWMHLVVVLAVLAGLGGLAWQGARAFRLPTRKDAWHHLETGPVTRHRPLTASGDSMAVGQGDAFSEALWRRHQARMAAAAGLLRPRLPEPGVAARDPRGLRVVPLLLLVVAFAASQGLAGRHLTAFFRPAVLPVSEPLTVKVWLTPPEYTNQPPLHLAASSADGAESGGAGSNGQATVESVAVPEGTTVLVLVHGSAESGVLVHGKAVTPLDLLDAGSLRGEAGLAESGRLTVRAGDEVLLDRPVAVMPDAPPTVAFAEVPEAGPRGGLRLRVQAADDYGLTALRADVMAVDLLPGDPTEPEVLPLPLPSGQPGEAAVRGSHDLTAHRWAGRPVRLTLVAEDGRKQTGTAGPMTLILPERPFSHPVAQAIVAARKQITLDPTDWQDVVRQLDRIARRPQTFGEDLSVFLALRTARAHLLGQRAGADSERIREVLWRAALQVEEGDMMRATADLQRLRERLQEAMNGDLNAQQLQDLMQETRRALQEMMRALAQSMPDMPMNMPMPDSMQAMDLANMDALMRQIEELSRLGAEDAARDLLSQLTEMLDRMGDMRMSPQMTEQMQQMQEIMNTLRAMREQQSSLLDETFRADQQANPPGRDEGMRNSLPNLDGMTMPGQILPFPPRFRMPGSPPPSGFDGGEQARPQNGQQQGDRSRDQAEDDPSGRETMTTEEMQALAKALAERQEALTRRMEELLGDIGEMTNQVPQSLGDAALAMGDAGAMLGQGDLPGAMAAQNRALDLLNQGNQQAMQQMMQAMGQGSGMMLMPFGPGQGQGRLPGQDPLGRDQNGVSGSSNEDVGLPGRSDVRRAREILDELRRRANEPDRPEPEKDYLRRLIPRF